MCIFHKFKKKCLSVNICVEKLKRNVSGEDIHPLLIIFTVYCALYARCDVAASYWWSRVVTCGTLWRSSGLWSVVYFPTLLRQTKCCAVSPPSNPLNKAELHFKKNRLKIQCSRCNNFAVVDFCGRRSCLRKSEFFICKFI